jgi:hypothetical protein
MRDRAATGKSGSAQSWDITGTVLRAHFTSRTGHCARIPTL